MTSLCIPRVFRQIHLYHALLLLMEKKLLLIFVHLTSHLGQWSKLTTMKRLGNKGSRKNSFLWWLALTSLFYFLFNKTASGDQPLVTHMINLRGLLVTENVVIFSCCWFSSKVRHPEACQIAHALCGSQLCNSSTSAVYSSLGFNS